MLNWRTLLATPPEIPTRPLISPKYSKWEDGRTFTHIGDIRGTRQPEPIPLHPADTSPENEFHLRCLQHIHRRKHSQSVPPSPRRFNPAGWWCTGINVGPCVGAAMTGSTARWTPADGTGRGGPSVSRMARRCRYPEFGQSVPLITRGDSMERGRSENTATTVQDQ